MLCQSLESLYHNKRMKYYHASGQHRHARKRRLYTAAGAAVLAAGLCITSLWMFRHSGEGVSVEPDRVTASGLRIGGCGNGEKGRRGLEYSSVPQLKKLAEYEAVC